MMPSVSRSRLMQAIDTPNPMDSARQVRTQNILHYLLYLHFTRISCEFCQIGTILRYTTWLTETIRPVALQETRPEYTHSLSGSSLGPSVSYTHVRLRCTLGAACLARKWLRPNCETVGKHVETKKPLKNSRCLETYLAAIFTGPN